MREGASSILVICGFLVLFVAFLFMSAMGLAAGGAMIALGWAIDIPRPRPWYHPRH